MAWWRPTDLTQEVIDKANEYLLSCEDKEIEQDEGNRTIYKLRVKLPSIEWLSRYIKVARSTVYEWRKLKTPLWKEFSDIIEDLLSEQAEKLLNNGLSWDYNPTIAKVVLTKHWYTDKQEIDQKTEHSFNELSNEQVQKIAKQALKNG